MRTTLRSGFKEGETLTAKKKKVFNQGKKKIDGTLGK